MNAADRKSFLPYVVAAGLALILISSFLRGPHPESISYSEFKTLVRKGKVSDLTLDAHVITGTLATDGLESVLAKEKIEALQRSGPGAPHFVTTRVDDPGLVSELEAANAFEPPRPVFLPVPTSGPREYSERTAEAIDAEIQTLLEAAHGRVRATLTAKRATLEALAKRLIEAEVVDRETLLAVIAASETPRPFPDGPGPATASS